MTIDILQANIIIEELSRKFHIHIPNSFRDQLCTKIGLQNLQNRP